MPKVTFRPKAKIMFVALANVEKFLGAAREYGVPEMSLFEPTDVVEGRKGPLVHVIDCLDRIGTLVSKLTHIAVIWFSYVTWRSAILQLKSFAV